MLWVVCQSGHTPRAELLKPEKQDLTTLREQLDAPYRRELLREHVNR